MSLGSTLQPVGQFIGENFTAVLIGAIVLTVFGFWKKIKVLWILGLLFLAYLAVAKWTSYAWTGK